MSDPGAYRPARRDGSEPFHRSGEPIGTNVLDFWRWSGSDLLSNATRGVVAEYIVARALRAAGDVRNEWGAYDLETPEGIRVEVKASAYAQAWRQAKPSKIIFGIRPARTWDEATGVLDALAKRHSDVHVFCVLTPRARSEADPLDLNKWRFHVLPTRVLDERAKEQKTIGLGSLQRLGTEEVGFEGLRTAVCRAAGRPAP